MIANIAPIGALLIGVALLQLGNGLQGTLVPVRAQVETFSQLQIGLLGSAYFLGFALGCYLGPYLVRSVGHIRTFTAIVALASALVLAHPLIVEPNFWSLIRVISGFCFATLYMVIESWLNERSSNDTRGIVFAGYAVISFGMLGLGQLLLPLGEPADYPLFLISSILVSLAAIPVALTRAAQPAQIAYVHVRIRHLYHISPVGFLGCFAVGAANGALWALAPLFVQLGQADTTGVAVFMAVLILSGALGQWPLGLLSDRFDRRIIIVFAAFMCVASGLALAVFGGTTEPVTLGLVALLGFFAFPLYTLSVAHVNDAVEPEGFVEAASGLLLIWGAGAVAGPFVASGAMALTGRGGLFLTTAAIHTVLIAFTLYRLTQRPQMPPEDRGEFIDAVSMGQTVSAVDTVTGRENPGPAG